MKETADYWDLRAKDFLKNPAKSKYESRFIEMAGIEEGESVFDMGCASGTLAIPLAQEGHRVLACDFSEKMIEGLKEEISKRGLEEWIMPMLLDWNETWDEKEIFPCDVAIASRSLMADDMADAIMKLNQVAIRKVIITAPAEFSSRWNINAAKAIGFEPSKRPGYLDIVEVLDSLDIGYGLEYIEEEDKGVEFNSKEECFLKLKNGFPDELAPEEESRLIEFVDSHYSNGKLDVKWPVKWAFIYWGK